MKRATRKELIDFIILVAQNLGDWKPDMREDYGLQNLYDKADKILDREVKS